MNKDSCNKTFLTIPIKTKYFKGYFKIENVGILF